MPQAMLGETITFKNHAWKVLLESEADRSVAAEIFKLREYRAAEEIIAEARDPIFDVGAHRGLFVLYARALNPTVPIIAIEPEAKNLAALRNHLKANNVKGVAVVPAAIAGETAKRRLIISPDTHNHHLARGEDAENYETRLVTAYSLPALFKKLNLARASLVKIDIEGGEYEVFKSLRPADFKKLAAIIMEYHDYPPDEHRELEQRLREQGFGVQVFPSKFDNRMGFMLARNKRR